MKFLLLALTLTVIAGCGRQPSAPVEIPPAAAIVEIRAMQFSPASLEVKKGDVVEWKNDDVVPHTATSASFDSGSIAPGDSWRHTFTEQGNISYSCTFHPTMKGTVVVK